MAASISAPTARLSKDHPNAVAHLILQDMVTMASSAAAPPHPCLHGQPEAWAALSATLVRVVGQLCG